MYLKKYFISCMFALTIMGTTISATSMDNIVECCSDRVKVKHIVIKEKIVNGVRYVRRWDAANNKWLDPKWIKVD